MVWLRRPPTVRLDQRGREALRARGELGSNLVALGGLLVSSTALRRFMSNRSRAKVSGNQLVGFEPRYYFAFNERPRAC